MKRLFAVATLTVLAASSSGWAEQRDLDNGKERYEETCVACHGENGKGTMPGMPDFTSRKGPLKKGNSQLLESIRNGVSRPGADIAMPPMGGNPDLSEEDLRDILSYIRKTFK